MYKVITLILLLTLTSCVNLENICKESKRANGDIINVTGVYNRTVTIIINGEVTKIYRVPKEQDLNNIPYCTYKGRKYWFMP